MTGWLSGWRSGLALLEPTERRRMRVLLVVMVVVALFESASVAAIVPFLEVATDPSAVGRHPVLAGLASTFGATAPQAVLAVAGGATLLVLLLGNATGALAQLLSARVAWDAYRSLGTRVLSAYLDAPYLVHLERSPPDLVRAVLGETGHYVGGWVLPSLQLVSRSLVVVLLMTTLLVVEPVAAAAALLTVGGAYGAVLVLTRRRLETLARLRDDADRRLHRNVTESFAAFREVRMHDTGPSVRAAFEQDARAFATSMASVHAISSLPKYLVEVLALGAVVGVAVALAIEQRSSSATMGFLGLFAFAGYRLVPALQACFASATSMRFAAVARERLARDLAAVTAVRPAPEPAVAPVPPPRHEFGLEDATFRYPGAPAPALDRVTVSIRVGASTAIVGPTGAGKSTLLDLLLGLTEPTHGRLVADGRALGPTDLHGWRKHFAYVSQNPVLLDATVAENIAFGVPRAEIDVDRMRSAAWAATIDEHVERHLPLGYETVIGDRGARLSGGQRQRIAIARALYARRPILVLDEGTSALDERTEVELLRRLREHSPRLTLVTVTHRHAMAMRHDAVLQLRGPGAGVGAREGERATSDARQSPVVELERP